MNAKPVSEDTKKRDEANKALIRRIRTGDQIALSKLCEDNEAFVRLCARKHIGAHGSDLAEEDLIQEGMIGLIKAAEKADPDRPETFLSYAGFYIEQAMIKANGDQGFAISFPEQTMSEIGKLQKADKELQHLQGEERIAALAKALSMSPDKVRELLSYTEYLTLARMDKTVAEEGDSKSLGDSVSYGEDEPFEKTDGHIEKEALKDAASEMTECLDDKERSVIELRFGLAGKIKQTLEEVAHRLKTTKERIRQIEARAMRKMRHFARERTYSRFSKK